MCVFYSRDFTHSFCNSRHAGHEIKVSLIPPASLVLVQASLCHSLNKNDCSPHPSFFSGRPTSRLPAIGPPLFPGSRFRFIRSVLSSDLPTDRCAAKLLVPWLRCPFPFVLMLITHDAPLLMPVLSLTLSLSTFLAGKSQCQLSGPWTIVLTELRSESEGVGVAGAGAGSDVTPLVRCAGISQGFHCGVKHSGL